MQLEENQGSNNDAFFHPSLSLPVPSPVPLEVQDIMNRKVFHEMGKRVVQGTR